MEIDGYRFSVSSSGFGTRLDELRTGWPVALLTYAAPSTSQERATCDTGSPMCGYGLYLPNGNSATVAASTPTVRPGRNLTPASFCGPLDAHSSCWRAWSPA